LIVKKGILRILCCLLIVSHAPAKADDDDRQYNQVRFQVQRSQAVANDLMQALLSVHEEDTDPAALADRINKTMSWALETATDYKALKLITAGYRTQPVYRKETLQGWRGDQDLQITGSDLAAVAELIGKLQARLQLRSVSFLVSDDKRSGVEDQLIRQALDACQERARLIADQLGFKSYRIVDLNVSTGGEIIRPQERLYTRAAAAEGIAAPALEAGESKLVVSVNAAVELQ
jgi:predicted secreted protein